MSERLNDTSDTTGHGDDDVNFSWLTDDVPHAQELRGRLRAIMTWRNEVIEHVATLTGANATVLRLDEEIAQRRREVTACGIAQNEDGLLADLIGLRRAAGKQAVFRIIDHPLVRWVLETKIRLIAEIRNQVRAYKKSQHQAD